MLNDVKLMLRVQLVFWMLLLPSCLSVVKPEEKAPENEALIPFVAKKRAWERLNPAFPFYPVDRLPALEPTAISQAQYARYWKRWEPLWPHIESFRTLFERAEKDAREIEVQALSAKVATFLLVLNQVFDESDHKSFQALESYQHLGAIQTGLHDLLFLLKAKGSIYIHYRGEHVDVNEEEMALRSVMLNLRQHIQALMAYKRMLTLFHKGFLPEDK